MRHPARALRQLPKASVPGTPEFTWERFSEIAEDLPPLFQRHWRELALNQDSIELAPDWARYLQLEIAGAFRVLTVRDDGRLVGYAFVLGTPHLHYVTTMFAHVEMFWLDPAYRKGWTGVRMFKEVIRGCRDKGARVLQVPTKMHFMGGRVGKLLGRLGFKPIEVIYSKVL